MHIHKRFDRVIEKLQEAAGCELDEVSIRAVCNEILAVYNEGVADAKIDEQMIAKQQVRSRLLERAKAAEGELKTAAELIEGYKIKTEKLENLLSLMMSQRARPEGDSTESQSPSSSSQTSTSPSSPESEPHQSPPPSSSSTK